MQPQLPAEASNAPRRFHNLNSYLPYHTTPTLFIPPQYDDDNNTTNMDPSQSEYNTFYPYSPHEVKHRKRTTAAQLTVLEGVYADKTTKPNAGVRASIARQLDMSPRAVQVWFQNRRAKEKTLSARAKVSGRTAAIAAAAADEHRRAQESSPSVALQSAPPQLHVDTHSASSSSPPSSSWPSSPPLASNDSSNFLSLPEIPHHELRRGSLPNNVFSNAYVSPQMDYARHGSMDAIHHLQQVQQSPYALARNGASRLGRVSSMAHMMLPPRPASDSPPFLPQQLTRHASMDASTQHSYPHHIHAPLRPVPEPIPGPLPSQNFTFGAATTNISPPPNGSPAGDSEDGTNYSSRYSSLASVASTNSYYSDYSDQLVGGERHDDGSHSYDNGLFVASADHMGSTSAPDVACMPGNEMPNYGLHDVNGHPSFNRSRSMPDPYSHESSPTEAVETQEGNMSGSYYAGVHSEPYAQPASNYDNHPVDPSLSLRMPGHHGSVEDPTYSSSLQYTAEPFPFPNTGGDNLGQEYLGGDHPASQLHMQQPQHPVHAGFGGEYGQVPVYAYV